MKDIRKVRNIIEALCSFWPISEITVADRGIREGILLDLMHRNQKYPNKVQKKHGRRGPYGRSWKNTRRTETAKRNVVNKNKDV